MFQFPDPHFKKRNKKRRVINVELVRALAKELERQNHEKREREGEQRGIKKTQILLQTDVQELAIDMVHRFQSSPWFQPVSGYDGNINRLSSNPSPHRDGLQTEREKCTLRKGMPVYRMMFERNDSPYDEHEHWVYLPIEETVCCEVDSDCAGDSSDGGDGGDY
jgi:tRNA (guanine-N7-)-methyltransferase